MNVYDVLVVGAGPAGATVAAMTARAGLSTLVLERTQFPREKVCGDCLNPGAWENPGSSRCQRNHRSIPSAKLRWVEFLDLTGRPIRFELPNEIRGERGIRRKLFDDALITHAISAGAQVSSGIRYSRFRTVRVGKSPPIRSDPSQVPCGSRWTQFVRRPAPRRIPKDTDRQGSLSDSFLG